jgi:hypothetical protein
MSTPEFHKMTGEEAEAWLRTQDGWQDCFMHIHGPECCIISHTWKRVDEIRETDPNFKYICGPQVLISPKWTREQQKPKEDYLWRWTASWWFEKLRSKIEKEVRQ